MTPHEALEELKNMATCRCDEAYTGRGRHDPYSACDYADEVRIVADYVAKLEARTPSVTPLVWQQMANPMGDPSDLHRAWCPLFKKYYWAERENMIPQIESRRTARIMRVIQGAPNE
jgi:hypothetical protein